MFLIFALSVCISASPEMVVFISLTFVVIRCESAMILLCFDKSLTSGLLLAYFMSATTFRRAFTYVQDISLIREK
ncbi:hypothetical protein D3C87_1455610 [compost metagenome]